MDKLTAIELAGMTDKEIRIKIQLVLAGEQPEQKTLEQHDDLYPAWRDGVKNKHIPVTARGCQNLIGQRKGARVSMREAAHIWNTWGNRGIGEGYLMFNPDYQEGNRKAKYILA